MTLNADNKNDEPRKPNLHKYAKLTTLETIIYFLMWGLPLVYVSWKSSLIKKRRDFVFIRRYNQDLTEPLYPLLGTKFMDTSDFEWKLWLFWFMESVVWSNLIHFFIMRIVEYFSPKHRFVASMAFTMCFILKYFGVWILLIIIFQMALLLACTLKFKSQLFTWTIYSLMILAFASNKAVEKLLVVLDYDYWALNLLISGLGMGNLRTMSFCLEVCFEKKESKEVEKKSFLSKLFDICIFQFYFPIYNGGPIFTYELFRDQKSRPPVVWSRNFTCNYLLQILRYGIWHLLINVYLHYCLLYSLKDPIILEYCSSTLMLSVAVVMDLFFCIKYMVLYGLPAAICLADNIEVEGAPHCVVGRFQFTHMWKYFDKGLHHWLVRYIYIPLGGSNRSFGMARRIFNAAIPFLFVWVWHGTYKNQALWAALNAFGVIIEMSFKILYKTKPVQQFEAKFLTPEWSRRICGLFGAVTFMLLILSNVYFLTDITIGNFFMKTVYLGGLVNFFSAVFIAYSGTQTAMEIERWSQKEAPTRIKHP